MNIRKALAKFGMGIFCVFALSQVYADALKDIKANKKIVIAVDFTHPPYGMLDSKNQQVGTDIEMARLIAKDLNVELEVLPVNGPNRIPFLLTNKADIVIASFSVTEERKKVISFSKSYATMPLLIVAPEKQAIKSIIDLAGKSIAVTRGNTSDQQLTSQIKAHGVKDVNITRYVDEATLRTAVSTGQQDVFAASIADAITMKDTNPNKAFQIKVQMYEDQVAIGLRRDEPALQAYIDGWVTKNLKNGTLNAIYVKYFNTPLPKSLLEQ
ncbi:MAG: amino acid transporter [Herminiimonas sp.]|nr:amino acid transporter [Herminiimonas sp.]